MIDSLFEGGNSFYLTPYRLKWIEVPYDRQSALQVALVVPKKRIRLASRRNTQRRRMREAWRLHCEPLRELLLTRQISIRVLLIALVNEVQEYREAEEKIILILKRLEGIHAETADRDSHRAD